MHAQRYRTAFVLCLICLLTSFFSHAANNLAPSATVDRTVVDEGDSLVLTIRIDDTGSYDAPDYSPLQNDFEVYGSTQSSQHVINNGRIESHTEWQTTLIPKHSGRLQIPPLVVAGARTQPITIQVNSANTSNSPNTAGAAEPVFVEVQLDRNTAYVQQQILLTARVYVGVQLDNMQLTAPEFDNASVKQISDTKFARTMNGVPYEVFERTYAIFPQQPGELTIPELVFSAVEITGSRSLFDFPGRGRPLRKISKQLTVHVKPIPKNFSGSVWLPARNLTLAESWSGDPHHLATGDSITRSITIRADGLLASQLPKLDEPKLDSAKFYNDQPKLDDAQDSSGVHGKRVENSALIPTRAGALQLPETRVVWWDVDSDSEKIATLPNQSLTITAGANTATSPSPEPQSSTQPAAATQPQVERESTISTTPVVQSKTLLWWQVATALFAMFWIFTLLAYWQLRRKPLSRPTVETSDAKQNANEENAWREFAAACRTHNPSSARQTLLQWVAQFYREKNIRSLEQWLRLADDQQLTRELHLLDNRLFGALRDSSDWNGENLLQVVQTIKKRGHSKNISDRNALPPLYPAA